MATHFGLAGDGTVKRTVREDAVRYDGRFFVPTSDETKWISTWDEFRAAGGNMCWSEDQTEIELTLPAPYKFAISFMRKQSA